MKYIVYTLITLTVVALATNPDTREHQYAFNDSVLELSNGSILVEIAAPLYSKRKISVDSYYICSLTKMSIGTDRVTIGYGFFGKVFILTDKLNDYDL